MNNNRRVIVNYITRTLKHELTEISFLCQDERDSWPHNQGLGPLSRAENALKIAIAELDKVNHRTTG